MDSWSEFEQHLVKIDSRNLVIDWLKRSIYKVPASIKDLNPKAYIPQFVTFGPYHCNYERVMEMDVHKKRALNHFIKNSGKQYSVYANAMQEIQHELMASYESLDVYLHLSADKFLQLMLLDGCFMLEILRANEAINSPEDTYGDYSATDPIFSYHGKLFVMPYIRTEMLMLENQLPMCLLIKLLKVEAKNKIADIDQPYDVEAASSHVKDEGGDDDVTAEDLFDIANPKHGRIERLRRWRERAAAIQRLRSWRKKTYPIEQLTCFGDENAGIYLNRMILRFINPHDIRVLRLPAVDSLHVLDLYRRSLIGLELSVQHKIPNYRYYKSSTSYMTHSAEKLHEYAIDFQPSLSRSLTDISFDQGKLKLPSITVDGNSEIAFLNMIAFERIHVGAGNEVTSYLSLMGTIIRSAKDVNLLITSNIIVNALGSEKSVADLFEGIFREVTPDPGSVVVKIFEKVQAYSKKKWNMWLLDLKENMVNNYFKSPWTFLTFLAATFVILLALTQTLFTIFSYYKPEKK